MSPTKEDGEKAYYAAIGGIISGVIMVIVAWQYITQTAGQAIGAFGILLIVFSGIGIIKPEFGAVFFKYLRNLANSTQGGSSKHEQTQYNPNQSPQAYTEDGDIHIEQHFHSKKEDRRNDDREIHVERWYDLNMMFEGNPNKEDMTKTSQIIKDILIRHFNDKSISVDRGTLIEKGYEYEIRPNVKPLRKEDIQQIVYNHFKSNYKGLIVTVSVSIGRQPQ